MDDIATDGVAVLKGVIQRVASRLRHEKPDISDDDLIAETVSVVAPDHMKEICPNTYPAVLTAAKAFTRSFVFSGDIL